MLKAILVLSLVIVGCSSNRYASDPQARPLTAMFSAVEAAMAMGIQRYSENHREFYSRPFLVIQSEPAKKLGLHERGLAKVLVLGETRPYTIECEVTIQRAKFKKPKTELNDSDYVFERYDKRLAKELVMNIISILNKRSKDKIDDFRPF